MKVMRRPRKLLERKNLTYELDDFEGLLKALNEIRAKYPDKLVETEFHEGGCRGHGEDEYCYCDSTCFEVNVYDVPLDKKTRKG